MLPTDEELSRRQRRQSWWLLVARLSSGRTQQDAATALGVVSSSYGDFERGVTAPSLRQLAILAALFDVPVELFANPPFTDEERLERFRWPRLWPIGVAVLVAVTVTPLEVTTGIWPVLVAVASVALIAGAPRFLAWRPLVWVGQRSYGIYLWHMLPVLAIRPFLPNVPLTAVVLVSTFVAAWASYRWVEQPIRHRRLSTPARPRVPVLVRRVVTRHPQDA